MERRELKTIHRFYLNNQNHSGRKKFLLISLLNSPFVSLSVCSIFVDLSSFLLLPPIKKLYSHLTLSGTNEFVTTLKLLVLPTLSLLDIHL